MADDKKTVAVIAHHQSGRTVGLMHLMAAAAAAAGCTIEFGGPGPASLDLNERQPTGKSRHAALLPLQLRGRVEHTYTPKPLTKRQKRRLRGKEKS